MAVKRKSKEPVRIPLPRRTKRCLTYRYKRPWNNDTHINSLPDEILVNIFRYFTTRELFCNVRNVCKLWTGLAMSPVLWTEINAQNDIPTGVLTNWIKASPLLKTFAVENRNDANVITHHLAKNCKLLESVKMQNCWGSPKCCFIRSNSLCSLVSTCSNLYNFNFSQSRFISLKFFRLISRGKRSGRIMKKCNYIGPMTCKQMIALFLALRDHEVHDTATICNMNSKEKLKLRDIIKDFQELQVVWQHLYYGENVEGDEEVEEIPVQMDA